jgi:hypothetical protein
MSTSPRIQHPGSRSRSAAGAALATLGVLIAVGIGALFIMSMSVSRAVRPPGFAPCSETSSGHRYRPHRRTSRTLRPGYDRGERRQPRCTAETASTNRLASDGSPDADQR